MKLLLDFDIMVYRTAFSCEKKGEITESPRTCIGRLNNQVGFIQERCHSLDFIGYLTGSGNFRKDIYPEYKANRVQPKPHYYDLCREYLLEHGAVLVDGMEADDAMGIQASTDLANHTIVSIDKDMLQVPCNHYNWVKDVFTEQDEYTAHMSFYSQLLMGDNTDNVPGIPRIGPANAYRILEGSRDWREMHQRCIDKYREHFGEEWEQNFIRNGRLLWVLREPLQDWWSDVINGHADFS